MKKIVWLLSFMFLLAGCGGKDEIPEPDNGLGTSKFTAELLFGTWQLYKVAFKTVNESGPKTTITFKSDGKYYSNGKFGDESGTFIFHDNGWSLICTNHRGEIRRLDVGSISATSLTFSGDYEVGTRFELQRLP